MPAPPIPDGFKLSAKILRELPEGERATAREVLWEKAQGKCALCLTALPTDGKNIQPDHQIAREEGAGGPTNTANLNLTHRRCNARRGNSMRFDLAKRVIRFQAWCELEEHRKFSDVTEKYLESPLESICYVISDGRVEISFGADVCEVALYRDPATNVDYCFAEVPTKFIWDDVGFQPRWIEPDHVRALAIDFDERPVHEPSNCRLRRGADGVADLMQFDGQHKTTAQMILGRDRVPMKIYLAGDDDLVMLQELILQIQNKLTKRRLSTYQALKKANQLIQDLVDTYREEHGRCPTETELVDAQPRQDRRQLSKDLIVDFEYQIFDNPECNLKSYSAAIASRNKPVTEKIVIERIIRPLVCQTLLSDDRMDRNDARELESAKIIEILNRVCELMLEVGWDPKSTNADEDHHTAKARNFFLGGAVKWWMSAILLETFVSTVLVRRRTEKFTKPLDVSQKEQVEGLVETLCSWSIWDTASGDQVAAWRSNTLKRVLDACPDWNALKLLTDFNNRPEE